MVSRGLSLQSFRSRSLINLCDAEQMNEDPGAKQSWVSEGDLNKMLQTFSEFPTWVTNVFKYGESSFRRSCSR
jgi:hypothetical protein